MIAHRERLEALFARGLAALPEPLLRLLAGRPISVAYGRVCLRLAYPELVHAPEQDIASRVGGRAALWISSSRLLSGLAMRVVSAVSRTASALRLNTFELVGVRVLSSLGFARGVRDARGDLESRPG